ncbi:hypothetical protein KAH37_05825 [bacterium]|nr:hypothetical protein [bacterium]
MNKQTVLFFILIVLATTALSAFHFSGSLSAGASYDSNVQYLYLLEKVTNPNWEQKKSAFVLTDAELSLSPLKSDVFSIDVAILSSLSLPDPALSQLNFYSALYYSPDLTTSLTIVSFIQLHHLMENYTTPEQMYLDISASISLIWMATEALDFIFETRGAYYHSFSNRIPELKGPTVGEIVTADYYLGEQGSKIGLSAGVNYHHFRDYEKIEHCSNSYSIISRYVGFPVELQLRFRRKVFSANIFLKYSYLYWLGFDEWVIPDGSFKKRRKDHTITLVPSISFYLPTDFRITLSYTFDDTLSNMGAYQYDYVDYRVLEHTVMMEIAWEFSTEK